MSNNTDIVDNLIKFELFKKLDGNSLTLVANELKERVFLPGDLLIDLGDNTKSVYFIISGQVKVYLINEDGKELNLAVVGPYETIGEISPLINKERTAYCEAVDEVSCYELPGENFIKLIKNYSDFSLGLLTYFAERILKTNKHFEELMTLNLKERTFLLLQEMVKSSGMKTLDLSQEKLASILSASRPRVSEALQQLEKDKKIKLMRNRIDIL